MYHSALIKANGFLIDTLLYIAMFTSGSESSLLSDMIAIVHKILHCFHHCLNHHHEYILLQSDAHTL